MSINIIKQFLTNKSIKHRDCNTFIAIDGDKEQLEKVLVLLEKQFPNKKFEINDLSDNPFISINKARF